jgi:pimeloyl-ACP methyl ester carboxylesterase
VQTVQTLSDDVIALMDFLNVEKAVLVGHSMGCLVAANLAITKPERIVASVWIGPVYPGAQLAEVFG